MRRPARALLALVLLGIVLARVSAATAGNTFAPGATVPYTGYGKVTVSRTLLGPTLGSLRYNLDPTATSVTSVTLVLNTATALDTASVSFDNGPSFACGTGQLTGATAYTYTCTPTSPQPTKGLTSTAITIQ